MGHFSDHKGHLLQNVYPHGDHSVMNTAAEPAAELHQGQQECRVQGHVGLSTEN